MVPQCVDLASRIAQQGFTVFMPLLFGEAGAPPASKRLSRTCVSAANFIASRTTSRAPVTRWLRSLCVKRIRPNCPGPGIGAIGMCFTGGFVLSLFVDDLLLAPVICQPGLPFKSLKPGAGAALGVSPEDLKAVAASSAPILGFRFEGDKICPKERFDTLKPQFGNRFEKHELPGDKHSVMTLDFEDDSGTRRFRRESG